MPQWSKTKEGVDGERALSGWTVPVLCVVFWLTLHAINHNYVSSHLSFLSLVAQFFPAQLDPEWSDAPYCHIEVEHERNNPEVLVSTTLE